MLCPKCGRSLPDDSDFCQYCGNRIVIQPHEDSVEEPHIKKEEGLGDTPENKLDIVKPNAPEAIKNSSKREQQIDNKAPRKTNLAIVLLTVICLVLAGLNIYQYNMSTGTKETITELNKNIEDKKKELAEKEAIIKQKEEENASATERIDSLYEKSGEAAKKAAYYDNIISALDTDNLGYASSNFRASESIIVVGENEKNRKFTLTANWPNGGSVDYDYHPIAQYGSGATIDLDSEEWDTSTKVSVIPHTAGVTTVTFSNDVDNQTFDVVIIVTED